MALARKATQWESRCNELDPRWTSQRATRALKRGKRASERESKQALQRPLIFRSESLHRCRAEPGPARFQGRNKRVVDVHIAP